MKGLQLQCGVARDAAECDCCDCGEVASNIKPINLQTSAPNMCKMTLIRRNNGPELNFKTNFKFVAQVH